MIDYLKAAFLCLISGCGCFVLAGEGPGVVEDEYQQAVAKWRSEHEERFRSPTGWLALTGHYWLEAGTNRIGTTSEATVQLPSSATDLVANLLIQDSKCSLTVISGGPLLADGHKVAEIALPIDSTAAESDCAVKLQIGERLKLQLVRRAGRYAMRVRDSQSERIKSFRGKRWFDVQPKYRVEATYKPYPQLKSQPITNVKGDVIEMRMSGTLEFEWEGKPVTLDAIEESPNSLFVIFKDLTNGKTTYGAGRFVDVELPEGEQSRVIIDFNKTYSPPCAWSPHTLCPLPPKQNHLPFAIEAGERT